MDFLWCFSSLPTTHSPFKHLFHLPVHTHTHIHTLMAEAAKQGAHEKRFGVQYLAQGYYHLVCTLRSC